MASGVEAGVCGIGVRHRRTIARLQRARSRRQGREPRSGRRVATGLDAGEHARMVCWPTMPSTAPRSRGVQRRSRAAATRGRSWRSKRAGVSLLAATPGHAPRRGGPRRPPTCQALRLLHFVPALRVTRRPPARCWALMGRTRASGPRTDRSPTTFSNPPPNTPAWNQVAVHVRRPGPVQQIQRHRIQGTVPQASLMPPIQIGRRRSRRTTGISRRRT